VTPEALAACAKTVLSIWLGWAPWSGDAGDTEKQRTELIAPVAVAVCLATQDPVERAFLAVQTYQKTHLARYVLEGRCHDGPDGARCDEGRARGPWQVHAHCRAAWAPTASRLDRYVGGARCALSGWRYGFWRWQSWAEGFQGQVGIGRTVTPWATARAERMGPVVERMRVLDSTQ
jgi:hypothetical protein